MRSPLTETFDRVKGMVVYVRENLSLEEYDLFLDMVAPEPALEVETKPAKKARKKSSKSSTKSPRASGMAAALGRSLSQQREVVKAETGCSYVFPDGTLCARIEDNPVHRKDGGYAGYHGFDVGKSVARNVAARSSTNGGTRAPASDTRRSAQPSKQESDETEDQSASSSIQNSEAEIENASTATGG